MEHKYLKSGDWIDERANRLNVEGVILSTNKSEFHLLNGIQESHLAVSGILSTGSVCAETYTSPLYKTSCDFISIIDNNTLSTQVNRTIGSVDVYNCLADGLNGMSNEYNMHSKSPLFIETQESHLAVSGILSTGSVCAETYTSPLYKTSCDFISIIDNNTLSTQVNRTIGSVDVYNCLADGLNGMSNEYNMHSKSPLFIETQESHLAVSGILSTGSVCAETYTLPYLNNILDSCQNRFLSVSEKYTEFGLGIDIGNSRNGVREFGYKKINDNDSFEGVSGGLNFYTKNNIDDCEDTISKLIGGLKTRPDHFGYNKTITSLGVNINIVFIFEGDIHGDSIHIGNNNIQIKS